MKFVAVSAWLKCLRMLMLILFVLNSFPGQSQTIPDLYPKPSFATGLQMFSGFIIPHTESIRSVSYSNPRGFEFSASWHYSDVRSRSYCNCFPRLGISAMYINFDNPDVLGSGFTLSPFVEPFLPLGSKLHFSIRFSAGAAYLNRIYHPVTNPDNLFYSTSFSYLLTLSPALNFRIKPHLHLKMAANYNHISNGGNKQPNKGINFPTISAGADYIFTPVEYTSRQAIEIPENIQKQQFRVIVLGTGKSPDVETDTRKLLLGLQVQYASRIARLSMLTAGAEFVNDGALKHELSVKKESPPDHKRAAFLAGHELSVGRFGFSQQLGIYFYSPAKARDPVYQRWGLDYHISKKLLAGINLKAHRHVADFLDFRIGYKY